MQRMNAFRAAFDAEYAGSIEAGMISIVEVVLLA